MGQPRVVRPREGEFFDLGRGVGVVIEVTGESTGGRFALVEHPIEPGGASSTTPTSRKTSALTCWRERSACRWAMRS